MNLEDINTTKYQNLFFSAELMRANPSLKKHNWQHTIDVTELAIWIANQYAPEKEDPAVRAAIFHDVKRKTDGRDIYHGLASAMAYMNFLSGNYKDTDYAIMFAITHHSDAKAPNGKEPVVENYNLKKWIDPDISKILWDADRLSLKRFGMNIDPKYLNLELSKEFANSPEHNARYKNIIKNDFVLNGKYS